MQKKTFIYGRHVVSEVLSAMPGIVKKIFVAATMDDKALWALIKESRIPTERLDPRKVTSQVEGNAPHQGVVAQISVSSLDMPFAEFNKNFKPDSDTLLVLMGEVTDPHNVGAIVRSAAAFGAAAVLAPKKKQAHLTPAAIRASAGMAFRVPFVILENTQQAISLLKEKGMKVHGLSGDGTKPVTAEKFNEPTILVLGNEGEGIPGYAKAVCDQFLSIPMHPDCESLNVASAAAVAMYAWSAHHPRALS
jgi:23S rRNA (guanosine2251-2'-O)-methyltransferase